MHHSLWLDDQGNGDRPKAPRIIVSISHQGTVKEVASKAFGADTTIIPAAGAGMLVSISHQGTVKEVASKAFGVDTTIIPAAGVGMLNYI